MMAIRQGRSTTPPAPSFELIPIDDLGAGSHKGAQGGLYPGGGNDRPCAHDEAGLSLARCVRPLDADGDSDPKGRIVLLSIGMSNTSLEFRTFSRLARSDPARNPSLVLADGGQGGASAALIANTRSIAGRRYWEEIDRRLRALGVRPIQVQVAWVKAVEAYPSSPFPGHALELKSELKRIVRTLPVRFPNLRLVYCSSRIFAGYASVRLSPEPYAYESGFSVKWLIEDQIKGAPDLNFDPARGPQQAPWLAWGPYLWANGLVPRSDGLTYVPSDFAPDGTHPGAGACQKVAQKLRLFFTTDGTARCWFARPDLVQAARPTRSGSSPDEPARDRRPQPRPTTP